ncbi:MAG: ABC transporter ATP-binding protein [Alphaproteobacteria bacterium]|nr:ABC transporter ATP-binding protein [Alphaproteobacteria bacterium]
MPSTPLPCLRAKGLTRIYNTGSACFSALKDVSFDVHAGEFIAVTGRSGSGKSTLINLLAGLDRATSGTIQMGADGADITLLSEEELAWWRGKNAGIVFQFFQLLPSLSVLENTLLPMDLCGIHPKRERRDRVMNLLEELGIADHASKLPRGLSGGEQQRAAIARALVNDPELIFADEPTGNLDSATGSLVMELFAAQADKGKTVIMVTHDLDLAQFFSRTITLSDGEIVETEATA